MGLGLGDLQTDILDSLDAAKAEHADGTFLYHGGSLDPWGAPAEPGGMALPWTAGEPTELPPGVYDLRATLRWMALKAGAFTEYRNPTPGAVSRMQVRMSFQSGFSNSVRRLLKRGALLLVTPDGKRRAIPAKRFQARFVAKGEH